MCVLPALLNHLSRVICTRRQVVHLEVSIGYRLGIDRVSLEPRLFLSGFGADRAITSPYLQTKHSRGLKSYGHSILSLCFLILPHNVYTLRQPQS